MNILVGIPTKDKIDIEAAISIMNLDWDGHTITYTHADGMGVYGVAQARNRLVTKALEGDYDKILMIDSDMIVPEDFSYPRTPVPPYPRIRVAFQRMPEASL